MSGAPNVQHWLGMFHDDTYIEVIRIGGRHGVPAHGVQLFQTLYSRFSITGPPLPVHFSTESGQDALLVYTYKSYGYFCATHV
jgi:hypothetical protein